MIKLPFSIIQKRDIAGVLAMEVMFFYTLSQMDYGLALANYDSNLVIFFKLATAAVSLLFAAVSFAVLYLAPRFLPGSVVLAPVIYSFIPIFLFTNVIHQRYFEMPISLGTLYSLKNLPFATGYTLALARPGDLIYAICAGLLLFLGFRPPKEVQQMSKARIVLVLILIFLVSSIMRTGVFTASLAIKHGSMMRAINDTILNKTDFSVVATRYGFLTLFTNNLIGVLKHQGRDLAIDSRSQYARIEKIPLGTKIAPNVIMLQVESLDYEVLGKKVGGREITPFLNSLISRSLFFTSFYAQHTAQGGTSDADFSSLTSFYPLAYKPSFYASGLESLATLPYVLQLNGYATAAFHANKAGFWGRSSAFNKMGFERFYSLRNYSGLPGKGIYVADGPFLDRTLRYLEKTSQPYFAYVVTMSSHGDYRNLKYVTDEMLDEGIRFPEEQQTENYFRVINYVDSCLGKFFNGISAQKKPFILIIYGDHTSGLKSAKYNPRKATPEKVPLFIVYSDMEGSRIVDTPSSQIDLPPTVLSLVGITSPGTWQGINLISENRERLYLKNRRISVGADEKIKVPDPGDGEWEETVYRVEKFIR